MGGHDLYKLTGDNNMFMWFNDDPEVCVGIIGWCISEGMTTDLELLAGVNGCTDDVPPPSGWRVPADQPPGLIALSALEKPPLPMGPPPATMLRGLNIPVPPPPSAARSRRGSSSKGDDYGGKAKGKGKGSKQKGRGPYDQYRESQ